MHICSTYADIHPKLYLRKTIFGRESEISYFFSSGSESEISYFLNFDSKSGVLVSGTHLDRFKIKNWPWVCPQKSKIFFLKPILLYFHIFHQILPYGKAIWQSHMGVPYGSAIWQSHMAAPYGRAIWQCHMAVPYGSDMAEPYGSRGRGCRRGRNHFLRWSRKKLLSRFLPWKNDLQIRKMRPVPQN